MYKGAQKAWRTALKQNRSKKLEAPSWLWTSVVQARHEADYLEHCQQYTRWGAERMSQSSWLLS